MTITVVGGKFATNEPACWWGMVRGAWNCPDLTAQAAVYGGSQLSVGRGSITNIVLALNEGDAEHYVVARMSTTTGPVLDSRHIAGMWLRDNVDGVVYLVGREPDQSALVMNRLVTGNFPASANITVSIFKSGVTFEDGTVTRVLGQGDLDERGEYIYNMYMSPSVVGGPCHHIYVTQGAEQVGMR